MSLAEKDIDIESPESNAKHIVSFEDGDPENPYNWSRLKKLFIVFIGTLFVLNSTIDSSITSGTSPQLQEHFNVQSEEQLVLPTSVFLIGYILGPLVFAPLSESNGRRWVFLIVFISLMIWTLGTALAPNWPAFLIFRLLAGISASPPLSVTGGLYADIYADPVYRGRSVAWFMTVASVGPAAGPIPGGFLGPLGWQWPFWFQLIFAGASLIFMLFLPETHGPTILHKRAKKIRKEVPGSNTWAPIDLEKSSTLTVMRIFFTRPFVMLFTEPIVAFSSLFLALIYAILFILFQAIPIIFGPSTYNFDQGDITLSLVPVSVGASIAMPVYVYWDYLIRRARARDANWVKKEEYSRLPLACLGGPFFTIGLFWIGWGARPDVHWIVPMLGGLPLGLGFVLTFMSLINYMVDAYRIYAASALGASSIARATLGVVLPFATRKMYGSLGIAWACSTLGFFSLAMCFIPFVFIRFGRQIRENSKMCQALAAK